LGRVESARTENRIMKLRKKTGSLPLLWEKEGNEREKIDRRENGRI